MCLRLCREVSRLTEILANINGINENGDFDSMKQVGESVERKIYFCYIDISIFYKSFAISFGYTHLLGVLI